MDPFAKAFMDFDKQRGSRKGRKIKQQPDSEPLKMDVLKL